MYVHGRYKPYSNQVIHRAMLLKKNWERSQFGLLHKVHQIIGCLRSYKVESNERAQYTILWNRKEDEPTF